MEPVDRLPEGASFDACAASDDDGTSLEHFEELDDADRTRLLVGHATRFSTAFLRWAEASSRSGLTYPRLRVLEQLRTGGPAIMRNLAVELGMTARNVTAIVDALEQAGLAARRPHPSDRRATVIELTPLGRASACEDVEQSLCAVAGVFRVLSLDEQRRFLELLARLSSEMRTTGRC